MRNLTVQELRFGAGRQENEILLWNSKLEGDVGVFEMAVNDLDASIKELKSASLQAAKKVAEDQAAEIRERKYQEEMQFGKAKLEPKLKYEMQVEENRKNLNDKEQSIHAKLPKLVQSLMARTQTGRDFGTNSRRKSTQQMYMCRLLPSSRIFRRCATNADCRLADLQTRRFVDLHFL